MIDPVFPPVRERNRHGIRSFLSVAAPEPAEALFDRVVVRLHGSVRARDDNALEEFANLINSTRANSAGRIFGTGNWKGGQWSARYVSGTTISGGKIELHRQGHNAGIEMSLWVNPIRTLGHLLDRYAFDDILDLDPVEFFLPTPSPSAVGRTLDNRDNMVADFLSFGGSTQSGLVQRVATYLTAFERALKARLLLELCPPEHGFRYADDHGDIVGTSDNVEMRLVWDGISMSQCEACWERHDTEALARVHALAEGVISAARTAEVRTHGELVDASVERTLGALSIKIPLASSPRIVLVIYAKAPDRLRIEVRYQGGPPQGVRERLPSGNRSLTAWFAAIGQDAARRVPWSTLRDLLVVPIEPSLEVLVDLLDAIADVTDKCKSKRRGILQQLLRHGAITATNRYGDAPSAVLERLRDRGVLAHVRLSAKDAKIGRRYRLAHRYAGLRGSFPPFPLSD